MDKGNPQSTEIKVPGEAGISSLYRNLYFGPFFCSVGGIGREGPLCGSSWLGERAFFGHGRVTKEGSPTLGADQGRVSTWFSWGEGIDDDVLDPIGVVT